MSVQQQDTIIPTAPAAPAGTPTTLITEHEVLLATAAAAASVTAPAAPARFGNWTALWHRLREARAEQRPRRRHYPPRYSFLEDAAMAREMYRL